MQTDERLCLALWFPFLACERMQATMEPISDRSPEAGAPEPLALVARVGNALRLAAVDMLAVKQGLTTGMTLADARARCPTLVTRPADPVADAQALDRLLEAMRHFTPMVALDAPDGLILDISGCGHLFGGPKALAQQARAMAGYASRHAFGPNAMAARALARHGGGDVAALPVAALELDDGALAALRRAGLRSIGDLSQRPMGMIAARFGEQAVTRLRQILGEAPSPIAPRRPSAPIRAEARFPEPIARTEDVMDVIEDLLNQAARQMEARKLGGRRFVIRLLRSDGARQGLAIETGQPVRDPAVVLRLLRERIDTMADPLDPGFGFDAMLLAVPRVDPLAERQQAMDGEAQVAEDGIVALVDRLGIRLGPDNVRRLQPCDRHLPEGAQRLIPATQSRQQPWPTAQDRPPRPLLLFDPPQPVAVIAGVPDGPPQRFRWRDRLHEVRLAEGPERIAAEWWRRRDGHQPGGAGKTRDYYRIEDSDGRRYWMFRHGLFGEETDIVWYLHGLFA
ncbi:Y-family DNA polymerase [Sphingobium cupriresistens]|uniref:DNA-directed DNA polymerase n=1 Tax=Sphingobium cupriresistens LL01 TaxID=1420583 RepID=A0A0J7Y2W1_9SPHN|nr:DNA polymerase Y family protein [Sphingobium cupriresistens]KMS58144.1 nucleotidyltransferase [Sphingobium cupriresistens LL01]